MAQMRREKSSSLKPVERQSEKVNKAGTICHWRGLRDMYVDEEQTYLFSLFGRMLCTTWTTERSNTINHEHAGFCTGKQSGSWSEWDTSGGR